MPSSQLARMMMQRRAAFLNIMRRQAAARQQASRTRQRRRTPARLADGNGRIATQKQKDRKTNTVAKRTPIRTKPADPSKAAASKLRLAKQLLDKGRTASARRWLTTVVKKYPESPEADEAKRLLAAK